jgi:hypothetical protein
MRQELLLVPAEAPERSKKCNSSSGLACKTCKYTQGYVADLAVRA